MITDMRNLRNFVEKTSDVDVASSCVRSCVVS